MIDSFKIDVFGFEIENLSIEEAIRIMRPSRTQ